MGQHALLILIAHQIHVLMLFAYHVIQYHNVMEQHAKRTQIAHLTHVPIIYALLVIIKCKVNTVRVQHALQAMIACCLIVMKACAIFAKLQERLIFVITNNVIKIQIVIQKLV
jgi:hypothetical protein